MQLYEVSACCIVWNNTRRQITILAKSLGSESIFKFHVEKKKFAYYLIAYIFFCVIFKSEEVSFGYLEKYKKEFSPPISKSAIGNLYD